ncbi:protein Hook homolog isoform X1 [Branchiostoma lanceolatum]|uniref:HOOK3 protein n=1 Tax=Branchiostoma lanceolatum TaxID=7740 RepID=A0A8K0EBS4_BRALA|nr:HOOK3 [Branchiostoma lanceolatum]
MDKTELCECLVQWLQTFSLNAPHKTVEDLGDGVAMSEALCQIAPDYFSETWFGKIKQDAGENWRLRMSNLKKVLTGVLDFYSEVLGQQINDFTLPDVTSIAEHYDVEEMGRLLQLILGCAVNCDRKQEYIQNIMGMEEAVQHAVMNAIQELMNKEAPASPGVLPEVEKQLRDTVEELNEVRAAKEEIAQRCHELDMQVQQLMEENTLMKCEKDELSDKVNQVDGYEDTSFIETILSDASTPAGRRYIQLTHQVEQLQEETYRLESGRDEYRLKCEEMEKEILDLAGKNEELMALAAETQLLKDEMDILRQSAEKTSKYEQTIETYKKKLEDLADLRRTVKILEEKNTGYMQQTVELEEELRKANTLRSQLDMYKRQVQELHGKVSEETKRADKAEFELKRSTEKLDTVQKEKQRIVNERDTLKETNEELHCMQLQQGSLAGISDKVESPVGSPIPEVVPPEIKEKMIRLQHENKMLKLKAEGSDDERLAVSQAMLDDANARTNELETENRLANQRILELQGQLEDMQTEQEEVGSPAKDQDSVALRKKLEEHMEKLKDADSQLQKKKEYIDNLEPKVSSSAEKIQQLQEMLNKKDDDMKAMEERYKRYLEKAKSVIRTLDPKQNQSSTPEVQALKNQLTEKERLIDHLERDHEKAKLTREQEEKLIVSAWYNMGAQLHRKAVEGRLANGGPMQGGQSFLARQRQATSRRTTVSTTHPGHARSVNFVN